jgi:hypothetical protein
MGESSSAGNDLNTVDFLNNDFVFITGKWYLLKQLMPGLPGVL